MRASAVRFQPTQVDDRTRVVLMNIDGVQPHCPECSTVLQTTERGFECRGCGHTEPFAEVALPLREAPNITDFDPTR